jgi:hypothetical protein
VVHNIVKLSHSISRIVTSKVYIFITSIRRRAGLGTVGSSNVLKNNIPILLMLVTFFKKLSLGSSLVSRTLLLSGRTLLPRFGPAVRPCPEASTILTLPLSPQHQHHHHRAHEQTPTLAYMSRATIASDRLACYNYTSPPRPLAATPSCHLLFPIFCRVPSLSYPLSLDFPIGSSLQEEMRI